ncbi:terminase large subunit [Marinifilum flexuosum]|uniref:Phage terminase large subunit-like protein n=1 Tax=Marinifilum flexuosum TaxID=1117708 RepID=A0A419WMX6_9BACT|nr:terminase TerL endonuclease subunit [Marinifilum flexuosum]RKD96764.1 phage terminase large subunit-like protein [Marinifilum flexuosum]
MHPAEKYAKDVVSGKILACEQVILACKRYFDDLETGVDRGLYFDRQAAQKAISFFQFLRHYKGKFAGKVFVLEPWQQFALWNIYGWKKANGKRRFRYAYIAVPRKNGKTALMAGIAIYMLIADGEQAAEVYTAATKFKQAKLCFNDAKEMVSKSPGLKQRIKRFQYNMHVPASSSKMEPLASDAGTEDGTGPSCVIIDEYHGHKTDEMFKVSKSGLGSREQPLIAIITTAGKTIGGPCHKYQQICEKILKGIIEQDNLFALIYTIDKDDDWEDPTIWEKGNPSYHAIDTLQDFLKNEYQDAKNNPSMVSNFKTKNLNIWVKGDEVWITDKEWMRCAFEELTLKEQIERLKGRTCYGGIDLASVEDLSALSLFFPAENGKPAEWLVFFWVPEDTIDKRVDVDGLPYDDWVREGWIFATPGNIQDYDAIRKFITGVHLLDGKMETSEECVATWFDLKSCAFDRFNSSQLVVDLGKDGIEMTQFGQGFVSMSYPTKELKKLVLKSEINHFGNPVLRWQISNAVIEKDAADNHKISKKKSKDKVDGPVSGVMAYGEYLTAIANDETEAYADHGIRFLED